MFLPSCEYHALTTVQAPSEHHALKIMPAAARHALKVCGGKTIKRSFDVNSRRISVKRYAFASKMESKM
jgi:hypothetical protein